MSAKEKKTEKSRNAIHEDAIWRQVIQFELNTANMWEKNWGFMKDLYSNNEESELKSKNHTTLPPIKDKPLTKPTVTPFPLKTNYMDSPSMEKYLISYNIAALKKSISVKDTYKIPCTTSQDYGWSWHQRKIDRFGPYAKGKQNIARWWAGGLDSMP